MGQEIAETMNPRRKKIKVPMLDPILLCDNQDVTFKDAYFVDKNAIKCLGV